ncbi:MAG: tRNA pseudouridine(55) synthase TruB [Desulfuromonas thiophila]|jgi:tRNA pseudouridine55 synthase|nr:tRNA pseudouridine(55) synthase TruB [Desulfuromonas thiophila]MDD3801893.1 tRNA pseudouridine(55) synthase TruB [Desulfuromonas thiophila]
MNGFLLLDKPAGPSSHTLVQAVRRQCRIRRIGHAGTLDPMASGLMVLALGPATRLIEYLMAQDKTYEASLQLGATTDTQDSSGVLLQQRPVPADLTLERLQALAKTLVGEISQVPPMYSALKRDGVPLYRLARRGEEVERPPRQVRIESFEVLALVGDRVDIRVRCSKGTYIRTLCHDFGEQLGCGACMTALRRTASGAFSVGDAVTLDRLDPARLPLLTALQSLAHLPRFSLVPAAQLRLINGVAPALADLQPRDALPADTGPWLLTDPAGGKLLALVEPDLPAVLDGTPAVPSLRLLKVFPDGL